MESEEEWMERRSRERRDGEIQAGWDIFTFVSLVDDASHLSNYLIVKLDEIVGANLCYTVT